MHWLNMKLPIVFLAQLRLLLDVLGQERGLRLDVIVVDAAGGHRGLRLRLNVEVIICVIRCLIYLRGKLVQDILIQRFNRCALIPSVFIYIILRLCFIFGERIHELEQFVEYLIVLQKFLNYSSLFKVFQSLPLEYFLIKVLLITSGRTQSGGMHGFKSIFPHIFILLFE
jgi:hypothetical protein